MGQSISQTSNSTTNPSLSPSSSARRRSPRSWSTSTASDSPGAADRQKGFAAADERADAVAASQRAYKAGDGAKAAELSAVAKKHAATAASHHVRAEAAIFEFYNPGYPQTRRGGGGGGASEGWIWWGVAGLLSSFSGSGRGGGEGSGGEAAALASLDLHGLLVHEALARVKTHLELCKERGLQKTLVITGRGVHSDGGVARIKPAVEEYLFKERGLRIIGESQGGAMMVHFVDAGEESMVGKVVGGVVAGVGGLLAIGWSGRKAWGRWASG